jgi:hypothetical protein
VHSDADAGLKFFKRRAVLDEELKAARILICDQPRQKIERFDMRSLARRGSATGGRQDARRSSGKMFFQRIHLGGSDAVGILDVQKCSGRGGGIAVKKDRSAEAVAASAER